MSSLILMRNNISFVDGNKTDVCMRHCVTVHIISSAMFEYQGNFTPIVVVTEKYLSDVILLCRLVIQNETCYGLVHFLPYWLCCLGTSR
jgi:hypothetical protein